MSVQRKVIRIAAEDSPNVRIELARRKLREMGYDPDETLRAWLQAEGVEVADRSDVVRIQWPGVLPWNDYAVRRKFWDPVRQCVGLDGRFWTGAGILMFPPDWLNKSAEQHENILKERMRVKRKAKSIGIDTAEGGDWTVWTAVDERGVLEQIGEKTPDTNTIIGRTIWFGRDRWEVPAEKWMFDRGGGGKQHADRLRAMGHRAQTVGFGEAVLLEPKHGRSTVAMRREIVEERYAYVNRRAQMYGELRELLDPAFGNVFAIPDEFRELRRQLSLMPLLTDEHGRLRMLSKSRKKSAEDGGGTSGGRRGKREKTLTELLGRSPDEADSLVLAIHGMLHGRMRPKAGAGGGSGNVDSRMDRRNRR